MSECLNRHYVRTNPWGSGLFLCVDLMWNGNIMVAWFCHIRWRRRVWATWGWTTFYWRRPLGRWTFLSQPPPQPSRLCNRPSLTLTLRYTSLPFSLLSFFPSSLPSFLPSFYDSLICSTLPLSVPHLCSSLPASLSHPSFLPLSSPFSYTLLFPPPPPPPLSLTSFPLSLPYLFFSNPSPCNPLSLHSVLPCPHSILPSLFQDDNPADYCVVEVSQMMGLRERVLNNEECPWKSLLELKRVRKESSRGMWEKWSGRMEGIGRMGSQWHRSTYH